jgi:hypothetical protein
MSSSANLSRRLSQLEVVTCDVTHGPAILLETGESQADALLRHEAQHGRRDGEPLFIKLVGRKPEHQAGVPS